MPITSNRRIAQLGMFALCSAFLLQALVYADTPPRLIDLEGAHNFRDLGGYTTSDGVKVKSGMLFRSDNLSALSKSDLEKLRALGINEVVDFRSSKERSDSPGRLPDSSDIDYAHRPIKVDAAAAGRGIGEQLMSADNTAADMHRFLTKAYIQFVEDYTPVYRDWMHSLLEPDNYPMVFHCTAGKDRTGVAAALLLYVLEVPMESIYEDFLATNRLTRDYVDKRVTRLHEASGFEADPEAIAVLMTVDKRYLDAAFAAMRETHGSIDNYVSVGLELDQAEQRQLRQLLLER